MRKISLAIGFNNINYLNRTKFHKTSLLAFYFSLLQPQLNKIIKILYAYLQRLYEKQII